MDPVSMDVDAVRLPRRREPINTLTGIFLKSVYFLDRGLTKCVIVGIFKNRGNSLGVLFGGRKGYVHFSYHVFNEFAAHFNDVTLALEENRKTHVKLDAGAFGEDIKVCTVFGRPHVFLYDGEHTLTLTLFEWTQFTNNFLLVNRCLVDLFLQEPAIKDYVIRLLEAEDNEPVDTATLPCPVADRLFDEVQYYKRWPCRDDELGRG